MSNNKQNLISLKDRTTEEQREIARKGGIASGIARRNFKQFMAAAIEQGDEVVAKLPNGETKTNVDAVVRKLWEQARNGDVPSIQLLLKMRGEDIQRIALEPPTFNIYPTE